MSSIRFPGAARACAAAVLALLAFPSLASAQLSLVGTSVEVMAAIFRGVDGGYDPKTNSYLMVGGHGSIFGVCVGADGKPKSAPLTIYQNKIGAFGAYPRVRYSPDIDNGNGGFLVVWVVEAGAIGWGPVHSRVFSCASNTMLGTEQIIDPALAFLESGPAIAYSATSKQFMVVFKGNWVTAKLVDVNGVGVGAPVRVSSDGPPNWGRDPGVAWNSATDDFGVSYSGGDNTYAAFAKLPAANRAAVTRTIVRGGASFLAITDIDYNPATNTYAMAFWDLGITRVAEIDAAGNVLGLRIGSGIFQGYDAVSIAANPLSGTYLLAGVRDPTGKNADVVLATELDGHGAPRQAEMQVSTTVPPARYTRVVSSTTTKTWNVNWSSRNLLALGNQIVAAGGPVAPSSSPIMALDRPSAGATVLGSQIEISGWAVDMGASAGTGIDAVHAWAWPVGGGPAIFVGAATMGGSRGDVAAAFAQPRFGSAGYNITGTLPAGGTYDLAVYARSTVAQAFNVARVARISVQGSRPLMWVDTPSQNATVAGRFSISGWALDLGSVYNSGVDAVHVWAYRVGSTEPIWVGAAVVGVDRPDVAGAFQGAQFNSSGFNASGTLPGPGDYDLVVYARSTLAQTFNNLQIIRVHVR